MSYIRVAIVGVGNSAKSLIEGVSYYTRHLTRTTGLMHPLFGGYKVADIKFVAAFDIDSRKVGKNLCQAAVAEPNRTIKIADPLSYDVVVERGPTHDSLTSELSSYYIHESDAPPIDVTSVLKDTNAEIVLNYLPTGSDKAAYAYADAALAAHCSFVNCMPTSLATNKEWSERFQQAGLVLLGDDIKSQCGATILNRIMLHLASMRGIEITKSEQINYGGNCDHFNLQYRGGPKERTKGTALKQMLVDSNITPSIKLIYSSELFGHKKALIEIEGRGFGDTPISIKTVLEDEDSPNSAGVVVDAIRMAKLLMSKGEVQLSQQACSYLMKNPPLPVTDDQALAEFNRIEILLTDKTA